MIRPWLRTSKHTSLLCDLSQKLRYNQLANNNDFFPVTPVAQQPQREGFTPNNCFQRPKAFVEM